MGVDAIELMPVQEFDGNDSWGYNPCFFFALDKAYGTPKMYKDFIDACHRKGMAVILDVVYNHATGNMPLPACIGTAQRTRPRETIPTSTQTPRILTASSKTSTMKVPWCASS